MTSGTIPTTTPVNRKRSRPMQRQCRSYLVITSLPLLALAFVLALSSQATALSISSSPVDLLDATVEQQEGTCKPFDYTAGDKDVGVEDAWEHEDEDFEDEDEIEEYDEEDEEGDDEDGDDEYEYEYEYEYDEVEDYDEEDEEVYDEEEEYLEYEEDEEVHDEEEEYDEEDYDEEEELEEEEEGDILNEDKGEDDQEYDDEEHDLEYEEEEEYWTPEEEEQMDILYSRYLEEVELKYGANWRDEYELVVDKEEIYVRFLEFEERREQERRAEQDLRILAQAAHKVLLQHEETKHYGSNENQNRTGEQLAADFLYNKKVAEAAGLPPPRDMVVINTGVSYYTYNSKKEDTEINGAECSSRNGLPSQRDDSQGLVGSR